MAWPPLRLFAGGEPKALAVHLKDVDMMREAVEERAGEPFRAENRSPFIEWQVAGDERGTALIALAEHKQMTVITMTGAASPRTVDWHSIDWANAHHTVRRLQIRIAKAVQQGCRGKVKALQRLLTHSFMAKQLP